MWSRTAGFPGGTFKKFFAFTEGPRSKGTTFSRPGEWMGARGLHSTSDGIGIEVEEGMLE